MAAAACNGPATGLLGKALGTAHAVADAPTAASLLQPFRGGEADRRSCPTARDGCQRLRAALDG